MNPSDAVPTDTLAMVVDDDPTMRLMLQSTLARAGIRSECFADGRSAIAAFDTLRPHLVLLDIGLPDIDGIEACRSLRALSCGRDTPVLMLTGNDDPKSVERSYEVGATDFIAKPINWEILAHRVRYILRSARAFSEVAHSRERLAEAQRAAGIGSWEWRPHGDSLQCTDEALRILGWCDPDPPQTLQQLIDLGPAGDQGLRALLERAAGTGEPLDVEHGMSHKGERRVLHFRGGGRCAANGEVSLHGTVQDVTQRCVAEERIRHLAYHDSLTGLPNRAWLHERAERLLARADAEGRMAAVMLLDIDKFKRINDTLGHAVGDQLLCAVAGRLSSRFRRDDTMARLRQEGMDVSLSRLGGDEFCVVVDGLTSRSQAERLAERVLQAFAEPFKLADQQANVSPSIGIALFPEAGSDVGSLLKAADSAMYQTKNEGRNNFSFYRPGASTLAGNRLTLEAELRRAVDRGELVLHYQPIMSSAGTSVVGLEALVRWQHPRHGLVMPSSFIDIAEEAGLIVPIGEWVLHESCMQSARWRAQGLRVPPVAVNVSGEQFRRGTLVSTVRSALACSGLDPASLKLEITESVLMRDVEATLRNLTRASDMGVKLSIDDFGTGYSSLAYLKRFPITELKLDRSFVADIAKDSRDLAIATAVIRMALDMSLSVVAEGVESQQQADLLRRLGCPSVQGFHFHKPLESTDVVALLDASSTGRRLALAVSR
jgi:diguanylate cyclase (GGDEF)-like protein